jgi:hypothetical protein
MKLTMSEEEGKKITERLRKLTVSPSVAKELKAKGFPQNTSVFYWELGYGEEDSEYLFSRDFRLPEENYSAPGIMRYVYAAPTMSEILERLSKISFKIEAMDIKDTQMTTDHLAEVWIALQTKSS